MPRKIHSQFFNFAASTITHRLLKSFQQSPSNLSWSKLQKIIAFWIVLKVSFLIIIFSRRWSMRIPAYLKEFLVPICWDLKEVLVQCSQSLEIFPWPNVGIHLSCIYTCIHACIHVCIYVCIHILYYFHICGNLEGYLSV